MFQYLKTRLFNNVSSRLFPIVNLEKVLTSNKQGAIFLNGKQIDGKKLADLKQEVHLFQNTQLWEIIHNTLVHQAQQIIFTNSQTLQDVLNGKMVLYTLDVQNQIIKKIDNAK